MAVILAYSPLMDAVRVSQASVAHHETGQEALSERDRQILEFEKQWWRHPGSKEQAVRELFDLSATRYYQVLNVLIDSPAALREQPMLVKRLRRMRSSRQQARSARRLGADA